MPTTTYFISSSPSRFIPTRILFSSNAPVAVQFLLSVPILGCLCNIFLCLPYNPFVGTHLGGVFRGFLSFDPPNASEAQLFGEALKINWKMRLQLLAIVLALASLASACSCCIPASPFAIYSINDSSVRINPFSSFFNSSIASERGLVSSASSP
jgi:hypothetical protein